MRPQAPFLLFIFSSLAAFAAPLPGPGLRVSTREVEPSHYSLVRRVLNEHVREAEILGPWIEPAEALPENRQVMAVRFRISATRDRHEYLYRDLNIRYHNAREINTGALVYEVIMGLHPVYRGRYVFALDEHQYRVFDEPAHMRAWILGRGTHDGMHYILTTLKVPVA